MRSQPRRSATIARMNRDADASSAGNHAATGRRQRKRDTHAEILRAAADLFAEKGYNGTSLDDVAEAAGVSKGTIFYNYKNKADLFEQLIAGAASGLAAAVSSSRTGLSGWAALDAAALTVLRKIDPSPALAQVLLAELFRGGRPWAAVLAPARAQILAPLIEILHEVAAERGGAKPDPARVENVAACVFGALAVGALDRQAFQPDQSVESLHAGLMQVISGLRGGAQPPSAESQAFG